MTCEAMNAMKAGHDESSTLLSMRMRNLVPELASEDDL
jgi:hypothetical protein